MKALKVSIYRHAVNEIRDATNWYEQQSVGLGKRFREQVFTQISSLCNNAFHHAVRYDDVRCYKIEKFPFSIHYTASREQDQVFAVIHTSRNPTIWKSRKPGN